MRRRSEVLGRFIEVSERKLKERKVKFLSRLPINCVCNKKISIPGFGNVRVCGNTDLIYNLPHGPWHICNEQCTAEKCKAYRCKNSEESVELTFREILASPSRCGNEYPKLAMLIWFLQDMRLTDTVEEEVTQVVGWKGLLKKIIRWK